VKKLDPGSSGHSSLMGYMMDGFGLYGPRGDDGKTVTQGQLDECHGHSHDVLWDGKTRTMYHYHWTYDFPYNVGCYRGKPEEPWNGRNSRTRQRSPRKDGAAAQDEHAHPHQHPHAPVQRPAR